MSFRLEIVGSVPAHDKEFNTSNSCMAFIIDGLSKFGLIDTETPRPKFPERDTPNREKTADRIVNRKSPKPDMVAAYKFQTMDGWLVHPAECRLLASVELEPEDEIAYEECPYWEDAAEFTKFCKLAADNGGFRVF